MRKHIVEQSRGKAYPAQEKLVKDGGFKVAPLRERTLYDVLTILQSGTCPDGRAPWIYARCSDIVRYGKNEVYQSIVGGFAPRFGTSVGNYVYDDDRFGVVPSGSAEALPAIST